MGNDGQLVRSPSSICCNLAERRFLCRTLQKNNVRAFVRSLYNARLLEKTEAESVALESHYISLEADGRVAAAEAFHKVINGLREARKGAQRLEELGYGTLASKLVPDADNFIKRMCIPLNEWWYDNLDVNSEKGQKWRAVLEVAKPYEIEIRKLKSARNALNAIIDRSVSGKQAVVELKKFGFDYDTWAQAQVDIGSLSDFDILKHPKENDRISTGTTNTAISK